MWPFRRSQAVAPQVTLGMSNVKALIAEVRQQVAAQTPLDVCDRAEARLKDVVLKPAGGIGAGRPAHDPAMTVALLVYAYSRAQRSSRGIERACIGDIAFRVVAANRMPGVTPVPSRAPQRGDRARRNGQP